MTLDRPCHPSRTSLRFIDLFAGIGGFRLGWEAAGHRCVFTSERDKFARQTYEANHSTAGHPVAGDIAEVHASDIPPHDVLLAGFPCQPFSTAGIAGRKLYGFATGLDCKVSGTAFSEIVRILEHHRPAGFLLENVPHLTRHDGGRTLRVIHQQLTERLGYEVDYRVIDAAGWVPQRRRRLFITGTREPVGLQLDSLAIPDPDAGPRLNAILHPEDGSEAPTSYTDEAGRVLDRYTLSENMWEGLKKRKRHHRLKGNGFGYRIFPRDAVGPTLIAHYARTGEHLLLERNEYRHKKGTKGYSFSVNIPDDIARTLTSHYAGAESSEILIIQPPERPRKLTPRECSRLMGYPDSFLIPVADRQAYKQFGNSVVPPVIEALAKFMTPALVELSRNP